MLSVQELAASALDLCRAHEAHHAQAKQAAHDQAAAAVDDAQAAPQGDE